MVGGIEVHHVACEGRARKPGIHDLGILVERGDDVLREPGVLQGLVRRLVTEDEPRVVTVGQPDLTDRALGPRRLEQRIRIVLGGRVPGAPGDDRLRHRVLLAVAAGGLVQVRAEKPARRLVELDPAGAGAAVGGVEAGHGPGEAGLGAVGRRRAAPATRPGARR